VTDDGQAAPPTVVEAAAMGDHDAFARIMATHDGDMTRICMVMCGDVQVARDAVQAAWLIAWRRLVSLRDPARLRPWLMSIAVNEARQIVRTEGRRQRRELQVTPGLPPDPAERVERLDLVAAVRRLSPDERRLIALRYVAGLTSSEMAQELGGSPASVRGKLARLIERLRKDIGDD